MRFSLVLVLLLILLAFLQYTYYAPLLPDNVASHFDGAGNVDGWSSKSEFLITNLALVIGMAFVFVGIGALLRKIPSDWINLPNKDYWLAPERRVATIEAIQQQMEWFSALTLAFLLGITQLTIQANLAATGSLGNAFWLLFGSFMVLMVIWLVWFIRKWYAKTPHRDDIL